MANDQVVHRTTAADLRNTPTLFVIYRRPLDYPHQFVVRRWGLFLGLPIPEPEPYALTQTLEAARAALPPDLAPLERHEYDDPVIVEIWLEQRRRDEGTDD